MSLFVTRPLDRRSHRNGGFTLIELIAVMVIIGLLAAAAYPTLSTIADSRGRLAAQQLLRDVAFARERAIATGTGMWVVFNATSETWTVKSENSASPGRAGATTMTDPANGQSFVVTLNVGDYKGVAITSASFDGQPEIGFDWLGKPLNQSETSLVAQGTVVLTNGWQLTVATKTGAVKLISP